MKFNIIVEKILNENKIRSELKKEGWKFNSKNNYFEKSYKKGKKTLDAWLRITQLNSKQYNIIFEYEFNSPTGAEGSETEDTVDEKDLIKTVKVLWDENIDMYF